MKSGGRTQHSYRSIDEVAAKLKSSLVDYLEASSHIRHPDIVRERRALFTEGSEIAQEPYIETTPTYAIGEPFDSLDLPIPVGDTLEAMTNWSGPGKVFPKPYIHQANGLQEFFNNQKDLIVTTGTGSGKTETFLWPILGSLLLEATHRPDSWNLPGVRALLLYPTNALVGDQVSRLRRLFGTDEMRNVFRVHGTKVPHFGMYTSRTPYPGKATPSADKERLGSIVDYYRNRDNSSGIVDSLRGKGRWPAKDIDWFAENKYVTGPNDSELFSRHEMQQHAPDILVTNYSMLEYMLLRPIERSIFNQTRDWLSRSDENQLLVVLDEAHLYRGSSGTEVSYLLRRVLARLGIGGSPGRVRFILTSASLGNESTARTFARDLTGKDEDHFAVITGVAMSRPSGRSATSEEGSVLHNLGPEILARLQLAKQSELDEALSALVARLGWGRRSEGESSATWLYRVLETFPPINLIMDLTRANAIGTKDLASTVFPKNDPTVQASALSALLTLATFANNSDRSLLPTRVHMMFRGIAGLYVCINPKCGKRRSGPGEIGTLGTLYTSPQVHCGCGGRVYELYSHDDCGAVFLRCYHRRDEDLHFLWHEPGESLEEAFLLVGPPHPEYLSQDLKRLDVDVFTGRIDREGLGNSTAQFRLVAKKSEGSQNRRFGVYFSQCPHCLRKNQMNSIQSMQTTGEAPFGVLVKDQFAVQTAAQEPSPESPNGGKKALLFADGRQRAARLARDLPRAMEFDAFRGALILAWKALSVEQREPSLKADSLYTAFVVVCSELNLTFFDSESGDDQRLNRHVDLYRQEYAELSLALDDESSFRPTESFRQALAVQLSDSRRSLARTCIATPHLRESDWSRLSRKFPMIDKTRLNTFVQAWVRRYVDYGFVDDELSDELREQVLPNWSERREFPVSDLAPFCESANDVNRELERLVLADRRIPLHKITIRLGLDSSWCVCHQCGNLQGMDQHVVCLNCHWNSVSTVSLEEENELSARVGYWRQPAMRAWKNGEVTTANVEEHSAQLSYRDSGYRAGDKTKSVYATTEEHELRFLGLPIDDSRPIDMLSCTTTMEVGIDIGALTAVGLRNIPPRRDNYQQRAGRAGRRGSSISTVVSFGQNGPHDSYYFNHPDEIIRGELVSPQIQTDNERLARRHLNAWLIQTFFHETIEQSASMNNNLLSMLGDAKGFFAKDGMYSFSAFKTWIQNSDMASSAALKWLPLAVLANLSDAVGSFVRSLDQIGSKIGSSEDSDVGLLDVLFDQGLLPSYAFPTDVVGLTIFDKDGEVEEQPQTSKVQALSEYAPGRTVVVNKKTYQIGGIYNAFLPEGGISELLDRAEYYQYCINCTFVDSSSEVPGGNCPICGAEIRAMPMIDPPGFAPRDAKALRTGDSRQEYSQARRAQLPTPAGNPDHNLAWQDGPGRHLRRYFNPNQTLLVANVNMDGSGFDICPKCGAARPASDAKDFFHWTPYPIRSTPKSKGYSKKCDGQFRPEFCLGTSFLSDVLLLRTRLKQPMNLNIEPCLVDAYWSAAEAISLAASRRLDIETTELSAGFRFMEGDGDTLEADIYLYDTAAGGAGYASSLGDDQQLLARTLDDALRLLCDCPGNCDRSCKECLKNYRNQFDDRHLDRHLGYALLNYVVHGTVPAIDDKRDAGLLNPVRRYLALEGRECTRHLRAYSALLTPPTEPDGTIWLDDYTLLRDLPDSAKWAGKYVE